MECPHIAKFRPQGQYDLYSLIDHLLDSVTLTPQGHTQGISSVCSQTVECLGNKASFLLTFPCQFLF
ncbi:hypothetical protein E2C01_026017 [Portunus trituberculatus]|uniref:Uncharacterized protein n=1 Tax=Portunus trituberculatus TaxID=210409 RepID=A0A5B7EEZ1_PORTR|nr:hypothetical protein [Portunus trituberculatus]